MPGISIVPMAATVAEVEPLTAPQKAATAIAAIASPPTKCPSSQRRRFTIFSAMLALSIMVPARMKNGIASSGNFAILAK